MSEHEVWEAEQRLVVGADGERRTLAGRLALEGDEMKRKYTIQEILACGCEPDVEHCAHCDRLRAKNAEFERRQRSGGTGLPGELVGGD